MIEQLRSLRDAVDVAIEALGPLDAVLAAWAADTVQARAQGTAHTPERLRVAWRACAWPARDIRAPGGEVRALRPPV